MTIDSRQPRVESRESPVEGRESTATADPRRVVVEHVRPSIDGGRFPIKRTVGERVEVLADAFADGHDLIAVVLRDRHVTAYTGTAESAEQYFPASSANSALNVSEWRETPMTATAPGLDEWTATFQVDAIGWHEYQVSGWVDRFGTWRRELRIKAGAGQEVGVELLEGSLLIREAAHRAEEADADWLLARADALTENSPLDSRLAAALNDELAARMAKHADRSRASDSGILRVWVDRERARFGAWYEMFPRSAGPADTPAGTLRDACAELTRIADLGFDVVYLPPIHPIGMSVRKGRNNRLHAAPGDPGSPWAIGSADGGHTAIDPGLGTLEDFRLFREEAERLGLEVALDLAWQCAPDHPWVREHPEWFRHRPDGTIKHAENPPKKYQDIFPFDFESEDWRSLWQALLDVTLFWIRQGVGIFRVDNPHTKTFTFWEWLIDEVHARHPGVLFLSEAFTRPKLMYRLAKAGFTQSYTYFTWRNTKTELVEYLTELVGTDVREFFRPNLFANTPDILHAYLQAGGRPAFEARLLLAATLGASYGIYSGFELCERAAVPGTEEYLNSEKYEVRRRDWTEPGIRELVARVNTIRHEHAALQYDRGLRFHETDNARIVAYSKRSPDGRDRILTIVSLDPHGMQHGFVDAAIDEDAFTLLDLLDEAPYGWHRGWNYVRFDPGVRQGHVLWPVPTRRT